MVRSEGQRLLRERLKDEGLTKAHVARLVHRSKPTIKAWLDGINKPDVDGANALDSFLGVPVHAWSEKPKRNGKAA